MRTVEPTDDAIQEAAEALRRGELVGMPTETVYGIAADAMNPKAVQATFDAKGRPSDNPLIVHIADASWLERVAREVPASARLLGERFWPGPLTLVLLKRPEVPAEVTAGLDTVAVRVPAHPVALKLIEAAGVPVSAPSANLFMGLSPTRAIAIRRPIASRLALILDGGPCKVGIESTIIDLTTEVPRIVRPGVITLEQISEALGTQVDTDYRGKPRRMPGSYPKHYSPRTPVRLVPQLLDEPGLTFREPRHANQIQMSRDPVAYAAALYESLRRLDRRALDTIFVEEPPTAPEWDAIWDRLRKASG